MTSNQEIVFQILAEGGEITISRKKDKSNVKFVYHHNEFDPTHEGLDVSLNDEYQTFEQPFQLINKKYPWYMLHIETVHQDFRKYISEKLVEKLNKKSIHPDDLEFCKDQLEEILEVKLNFSGSQQANNSVWSVSNY